MVPSFLPKEYILNINKTSICLTFRIEVDV